jgi:hypothetical protein
MAGRSKTEADVKTEIEIAKARLAAIAEEIDSRPRLTDRTAMMLRSRPWQGVGAALLLGLVLGASRRTALPLAPVLARYVGQNAGSVMEQVRAYAKRPRA